MRRILSFFILLISMFLLIGCGEEHVHEYTVSMRDTEKHFMGCTCGDYIEEEHKFGEWEIVEDATVDVVGKSIRECQVCKYQESREEPKLEHTHTYGNWEIINAPTSYAVGQIMRKCIDYPNHVQKLTLPILYRNNDEYRYIVINESTCTKKREAKFIYEIDSQVFEFLAEIDLDRHDLVNYKQNNSTNHIIECSCGYSEYQKHSFGNSSVVKEPTCTETGLKVSKCVDCEYLKEEIIEKIQHELSDAVTVKKPTCTSLGLNRRSCLYCDYFIEFETEMLNHELGATKVITEATCTNIGLVERKCLHCDFIDQEEIEMLEHEMGVLDMVVEATCTNIGQGITKCLNCDYTVYTEYERLDHVITDVNIKNATCTEDGVHTTKCINCDKEFKELLPKLEHIDSDWINTKEATCTESGLKIKKCTVCEKLLAEKEVDKLGHVASELTLVREATCSQSGLKEIRCSVCDELLKEEIIDKLSHDLTDWQTIIVASCVEAGKNVKVCTECLEEVEVEIIPKLEHTQVKVPSKEPTCMENGNTEGLHCDKCGKTFVGVEIIEKVDHVYKDGSCKWCKELKKLHINYYNGEELIESLEYNYGDKFSVLEFHDELNYFYGWFDIDESIQYTETFVLKDDLNVYAKCITIEISSADDWELISKNPSGNFVILNDINFSGDVIKPIDNFSGTIDGLNHKINDFTIKNNSGNIKNFGLFKTNSGEIKNIIITNVTLNSSATDNSGGSYVYGMIAGKNTGIIDNCHILSGTYSFSSTCNGGNQDFYYYIGGIVGDNAGAINNCSFKLDISSSLSSKQGSNHHTTRGFLYNGAFVGNNSGTIKKSFAISTIKAKAYVYVSANCTAYITKYVGGFTAYNTGSIESSYTNTIISGTATNKSDHISGNAYISDVCEGGFAARNNGKLYSCYSSGDISSTTNSGGNFGGFVGNNLGSGDIRNCYAITKVSSSKCSNLGGFVAENNGIVQNSYSNNKVTATESSSYVGGFVGKVTSSGLIQKCFTNSSVETKGGTAGFFRGTSASQSSIFNCYYSSECELKIGDKIIDRPNEDNAERTWILGILDEDYIKNKLYFDDEIWQFTTNTPVLRWEISIIDEIEVCGSCGCTFELIDFSKEQTTTYEEIKATCTTFGAKYYNCLNCNKEIVIKTEAAKGHELNDDLEGKNICEEDVNVTYSCKNCDYSYIEEIKAKGHNHIHTEDCVDCEYLYVKPTCTSKGTLEYICDLCDTKIIEELSINHEYEVDSWEEMPNCNLDGVASIICTKCSHKENSVIIEGSKTGHHDLDFDKLCDKCSEVIYNKEIEFIEINTVAELINIAKDSNSLNGNYILMKDLEISSTEWEPIGSKLSPFTGFFDGNSKTITNVPLTSKLDYSGLFGYNNGVITNLNVKYKEGSTFNCKNNSLTFGAICTFNNGTINACNVNGNIKFNFTQVVELNEKGKSISGTQNLVLGLISGNNTGNIVGCNLSGICSISFSNNANLSSEIGHGAVDMVVNAYYLSMYVTATQNVNLGLIAGINENNISNCSVDFTSCTIDNALANATYNKGKWGYLNSYSNYIIGAISSNKNEINDENSNSISTNLSITNDSGNYESSILENGKFYHSKGTTTVMIYE